MNITEYLTAEKDKWHRRYNDAEIEIDRLKRENERLEMAIHRLIMERDMAIKEVRQIEERAEQIMCQGCNCKGYDPNDEDCEYHCFGGAMIRAFRWRGVTNDTDKQR